MPAVKKATKNKHNDTNLHLVGVRHKLEALVDIKIWDMGYWGVKIVGYGILGGKNCGIWDIGGKKCGMWDMGYGDP